MNTALQNALKQELDIFKVKSSKVFNQAKFLFSASLGWLLMVVATPYFAMNMSSNIPQFLTGLFVLFVFFLGSITVQLGLDGLEKANKEKNAGELLDGIELGSKEEYRAMLEKTGRIH